MSDSCCFSSDKPLILEKTSSLMLNVMLGFVCLLEGGWWDFTLQKLPLLWTLLLDTLTGGFCRLQFVTKHRKIPTFLESENHKRMLRSGECQHIQTCCYACKYCGCKHSKHNIHTCGSLFLIMSKSFFFTKTTTVTLHPGHRMWRGIKLLFGPYGIKMQTFDNASNQ